MKSLPCWPTFRREIPDEETARRWFEKRRWGNNPQCPRCMAEAVCRVRRRLSTNAPKERRTHMCSACGFRFSLLYGTILADTKTSLRNWVCLIKLYELLATRTIPLDAPRIEKYLDCQRSTASRMLEKMQKADVNGRIEVLKKG